MVRLRHARYPLISLMHKKSGLDIQIVASNDSSNSRQIIKQYMDEHPNLYAVFALIKSMLDIRGLTDVYRGGLGSYSLFMMIMAVLKMGPYTGTQTLAGSQLMTVLEFYTKLDTYKRGLTLHPPYSVAKHKLDSPLSAEQESEVGELPVGQNIKLEWDLLLTMNSISKVFKN
jgi:non-canonical poly(A) RNA polymerase PAPD5/7